MLPTLSFGSYAISGLLGPGGVTETYLASKPDNPDRLYALKLLRPDRVDPEKLDEVRARFLEAGRNLVGLIRPGMGKVLEATHDSTGTYIVSEHMTGNDLSRLMDIASLEPKTHRPCLDPVLVGLIGAEIARSLGAIQGTKPPIFHLDLCPGNVIVGGDGAICLLDPGLAASLRGQVDFPMERWEYVPPEGLGRDIFQAHFFDRDGLAADMYGLGALLFRMLVGRPVCVGDSLESLGTSKREVKVEASIASPQWVAALRAMLAPDPEDRPASVATVVEWLSSGIASTHERQRYIAKAVETLEKGATSQSREIPLTAQAQPTGPVVETSSEVPDAPVPAARYSRKTRWLLLAGGLCAAGAIAAWRLLPHPHPLAVEDSKSMVSRDPERPHPTEMPTAPRLKESDESIPKVAGHLVVDTVPPQATIWVDGIERGKSFADLVIGDGGHRIVIVAPGHRMLRDVVDTTFGVIIRRTLVPIPPRTKGDGLLNVECRTRGKFPILVDDEETGILCPAQSIPLLAGKHQVGIFLPAERKTVNVEITIHSGGKPALATFRD